jgi:hypothetical protein
MAIVAALFFGGPTVAVRNRKAARWLARHRKRRRRGKVRLNGVVQRRDTGRPEYVYGRWCKRREIEHELLVAELEVLLKVRIERDAEVTARDADGEVHKTEGDGRAVIQGQACVFEVDQSGKMSRKQAEKKWRAYQQFDGFILVCTLTEQRMEKLRSMCEAVKDKALFTTFARIRAGKLWVDFEGHDAPLGTSVQ